MTAWVNLFSSDQKFIVSTQEIDTLQFCSTYCIVIILNSTHSHAYLSTWGNEEGLCKQPVQQTCVYVFVYISILQRYNSNTVTFTLLMSTIQWALVYLQNCATITTIEFQDIFIIQKKSMPYYYAKNKLTKIDHSPSTLSSTP